MQSIIYTFRSFNGIEIALEPIINNIKWKNAWIVLLLNSNGWTPLENIFWKSKRKHVLSFVFANCNSSHRGIYVKCITNTATYKSRCNWKNDNAILLILLGYFVYILVFRCLFYLLLFNGVLLRGETSSTNRCALTVIQLSIQQCKWKVDINRIFIFHVCFSNQ